MSQSLSYNWANGGSADVFLGVWYSFSTVGVGDIIGNGCGIQEQIYDELLLGSEMTERYHYRNWLLCICFRLTILDVSRWCSD